MASKLYPYQLQLTGITSPEGNVTPMARMWIPEGCKQVKAVVFAQQNMTEERLFQMKAFREELQRMDVALLWVTPWMSKDWHPERQPNAAFERMMTELGVLTSHMELVTAPIIPFGHSAQATFPWNFAAWNPSRTLCILSFHGDAPRTNLCGYGGDNLEWGRNRNIDGIPALMVEGEYEWWEARVRPALAFQMMYPRACISFLADTGRGHFDCSEETAMYMARFIGKALDQRLQPNGTLKSVDPTRGWLASRYASDLPGSTDVGANGADDAPYSYPNRRPKAAPWAEYKGDRHDAFWYFDSEMALMTERRYEQSAGKAMQWVGVEQDGQLVAPDKGCQTGMQVPFRPEADGRTFRLKAVMTDETQLHYDNRKNAIKPHLEVVSGPVEQLDDTTFRVVSYEGGDHSKRRSRRIVLVAVSTADDNHRGAVQPFEIVLP